MGMGASSASTGVPGALPCVPPAPAVVVPPPLAVVLPTVLVLSTAADVEAAPPDVEGAWPLVVVLVVSVTPLLLAPPTPEPLVVAAVLGLPLVVVPLLAVEASSEASSPSDAQAHAKSTGSQQWRSIKNDFRTTCWDGDELQVIEKAEEAEAVEERLAEMQAVAEEVTS
jgi:hypothetical protein